MSVQRPLQFIPFQIAALVDTPPGGGEWLHEVKYDGYLTQQIVEGGKVRAFTRRGFDWTGRRPAPADVLP